MTPRKPTEATNIAVIITEIAGIKEDIKEIKKMLECSYVTIKEFSPVRAIAYGLVGTISLAVLGALIALVVIR